MLLSIIVPVYNVESYLEKCITSLLRQGLKETEYEILLINDGSTDSSLSICRRFVESHDNIRLFSQSNAGLGKARNIGLREASGDYVCFVDSDDSLKQNGLSRILPLCDGKRDLVRYFSEVILENSAPQMTAEEGVVLFEGSGHEFIRRYGFDSFCWNYLYRKAFLFKNGRLFDDVLCEDFRFIGNILLDNPLMISTSFRIYEHLYRRRTLSTIRDAKHNRKMSFDHLDTLLCLNRRLDSLEQPVREQGRISLLNLVSFLLLRLFRSNISTKELLDIRLSLHNAGLLPVPSSHLQPRFLMRLLRQIDRYPCLYAPARLLFIHCYLPLVKPWHDRINKY